MQRNFIKKYALCFMLGESGIFNQEKTKRLALLHGSRTLTPYLFYEILGILIPCVVN